MFRPCPMAHVTLWFLASESQDGALLLARHGAFAPASPDEALQDRPAAEYREVFQEAWSRLTKLQELGGLPVDPIPDDAVAPTLAGLHRVNEELKGIWQAFSSLAEKDAQLHADQQRLAVVRESFRRLAGLELDLSRLFHPDSLLEVRIGVMPAPNLGRLGESLGLAGYVLTVFDRHGEQAFAVVAGPRGGQVSGLLSQAGWRDMDIPEALRTHPDAARQHLEGEANRLAGERTANAGRLAQALERHGGRIRDAQQQLILARPLAEAAQDCLQGQGQLARFTGWVPKTRLRALNGALAERFHGRCLREIRYPERTGAARVPTLVRYPAWLRPFAPLVRSYGLPRYGEFDPTLPFALGYLMLFGAMFGDVGHGAVIALLALIMGPWLKQLRWVGVAAGLSSMLFGWLYGSVFGYEDMITPVWLSPMHDPSGLLGVAVALGAGFILLTLLASIHNHFSGGRVAAALGAANGASGMVFYLGALTTGAGMAGLLEQGLVAGLLMLAGLIGMVAYSILETRAPWGERLLVTAIEVLETAISLFANTLSFMRVAAFSLNHVALAMAVFALADGLGTMGQGVALVLGNGIIIVLEGGIVAIQAIRLMYYEGFSRFFSGDGVPFIPLKLVNSSEL